MRDPNENDERRDRMAIAAAPYLHPKLQATQTQGAVRIEIIDLADAGRVDDSVVTFVETEDVSIGSARRLGYRKRRFEN